MANDTVEAVRQAEMNASLIEKEALKQKEQILEDARSSAHEMISSMTKEARTKAEHALVEAAQKGDELIQGTKLKAEKEVLIMREMATQKKKAAIDLVLTTVI